MKALLVIVALLVGMLLAFNVQAEESKFDFSIRGQYTVYKDEMFREGGKGLKAELSWKDVYIWGSYEGTEARLTGQRAGSLKLYGIGPGIKVKLVDGLFLFGEAGYYIPDSEITKNPMKPDFEEGHRYYWKDVLERVGHTELCSSHVVYKYELKSGIGGSVGGTFQKTLYKGLSANLTASYRILNLREDWDAYNKKMRGSQDYLNMKEKRDLSAGVFGIGLTYQW